MTDSNPQQSAGHAPESPSNTTGGEKPDMSQNRDEVTDADWNQVLDAVAEFVNVQTWVESKLLLEQHRNLLLTDTADEVLSAFIAQRRRDGDEEVRDLEEYRKLLASCRQKGIDAAFAEYSQKKEPFLKRAGEWLVAFVVVILILYVMGLLFT